MNNFKLFVDSVSLTTVLKQVFALFECCQSQGMKVSWWIIALPWQVIKSSICCWKKSKKENLSEYNTCGIGQYFIRGLHCLLPPPQ